MIHFDYNSGKINQHFDNNTKKLPTYEEEDFNTRIFVWEMVPT